MGASEEFNFFCNRISIKAEQRETISYRCKRITKQLNTDFRDTDSSDTNSFYAGSYGRETAIGTASDIDMIYHLPSALYFRYNSLIGNKQSALLQAVRNSIIKTYPSTNISADGQIISVTFDSGIPFEVLPAFLLNTDGSYTYANSNDGGSWKTTNPKSEIESMRKVNEACNGNLRLLCRMVREWKNQRNVTISGYLIDTLAYQFIQEWQWREKSFLYYDWLSRDFFEFLALQNEAQEWWRAPGSGCYVHGGGFQYKANQCFKLAQTAIEHSSVGQEWSAKNTWREIYGTKYPE